MQRQRGNVLDALAQRRNRDRKDVETIVEIASERSVFDHALEIAVRRGDDPHVDALGSRAAEAFELALLQNPQQLGLHFERDVTDLVEEQRAAVRQFEPASPARDRAGERALLVSEQFALEQAGGQRRRVHPDERPLAPRTEVVDRARDQLLAGARFAEDQHRAVGRRDRLDRRQRLAQGPALADDVGELLVKLALEVLLFVGQPCVEMGKLLVGARVLRRRWRSAPTPGRGGRRPRSENASVVGPADVQRSDLSVAA